MGVPCTRVHTHTPANRYAHSYVSILCTLAERSAIVVARLLYHALTWLEIFILAYLEECVEMVETNQAIIRNMLSPYCQLQCVN